MSSNLKISDFGEIALTLKPVLTTHDVPEELHYSIISDAVFEFANFIDDKTGSNFHEDIYALLDEYIDELSQVPQGDFLVAEIDIEFGKGKKFEMNLLNSQLENKENLMLDLEVNFEVRDLDEINKDIDVNLRFAKLMKKKNGIKSLKFNSANNLGDDKWQTVTLKGSKFGDYEQSLAGVLECILKVAKQWS